MRPRQHAAHIMTLKTKDERNEYMINNVHPDMRGLVKDHVMIAYNKRKKK